MKLAAAKPAAASQKTNPRPPPATRGINSAIPIMMGAASRMLTTKHKLCQNLVVVLATRAEVKSSLYNPHHLLGEVGQPFLVLSAQPGQVVLVLLRVGKQQRGDAAIGLFHQGEAQSQAGQGVEP